MFDSFFLRNEIDTPLLYGTYSSGLVVLSLLVAIISAVFAFQLVGMARLASGQFNRQVALGSSALALGCGTWAMHFIGMLAFELCTPVSYDFGMTFLSILPGLFASWVALNLLSRREIRAWQLVVGGVLVGSGIGSMHYSGMAAMRLVPLLRFDPAWFFASIVITVLLAMLALWIDFHLRSSQGVRSLRAIIVGGIVMGLAISGMHYMGMAAARFVGLADPSYVSDSNKSFYLALSVTLVTVLVVLGAVSANAMLRYREVFQRLTQSQSRNRTIVETAVDGIITIDAQGIVQDMNAATVRMFGWQVDEVVGRNISMLMPEPHRTQHDSYLLNYLTRGEAKIIGIGREVVGQRKDGSLMPMRLAVGRAETAEKPMFVGFVTDISERYAMEQELRRAKERAEQVVESKSRFLANISHEIRTPMNAILGFSDLVLSSRLDTTQHRHLSTVRRSAYNLLTLINDVLDTAKLEKEAVELEINDFSLLEICTQVQASLSLSADEKNLVLTLDYPATLPVYFKGDALRIQQVLLNLIGNAIKFTERGGVDLRVRLNEGVVELSVIDTGIGIPADRLDRIFEPFAQADASTMRRFGGTGLGTTIARQLAGLMGGNIQVESELGVGSCFIVQLPLPLGEEVEAVAPAALRSLPPLRILVADDVPQNLELLQVMLSRYGHQVTTVGDGEQALAAMQAGPFDIVLMDIQMPRLDGLNATRHWRAHEAKTGLRRMPLIALTASVSAEDYRAARDAGMDGFASKPVELPVLFEEIARVLQLAVEYETFVAPSGGLGRGVDWARGVALWGDESALRQAIRRFCQDWPKAAQQLEDALLAADDTSLLAVAHRLYGVAGNLALSEVHSLLGRLEAAARNHDFSTARPLLETLHDAFAACHPGDTIMAETLQTSHSTDAAQLKSLLLDAKNAVDHGEYPETLFHALAALLPAKAFGPLRQALDDFDFERAAAQLTALQTEFSLEEGC